MLTLDLTDGCAFCRLQPGRRRQQRSSCQWPCLRDGLQLPRACRIIGSLWHHNQRRLRAIPVIRLNCWYLSLSAMVLSSIRSSSIPVCLTSEQGRQHVGHCILSLLMLAPQVQQPLRLHPQHQASASGLPRLQQAPPPARPLA